ncbi:MAG: hypothetical protein IPK85_04310 [Gemmatimonadetes bacterium]|nr:hypothetical protein [Gemmatimonadota bacterium]
MDDTIVSVARVAGSGRMAVVDSLVESKREMQLAAPDERRVVALLQPWAYRDLPVVAADGQALTLLRQRLSRVDKPTILVDRYELPKWTLVGKASIEPEAVPLISAAETSWLSAVMRDSIVAFLGGPRRAERELRRALYRPSFFPPIRGALATSGGRLIIERVTQDSLRRWEIWKYGRLTGSFALQAQHLLQYARDSTIWVLTNWPSGVDTILVATVSGMK